MSLENTIKSYEAIWQEELNKFNLTNEGLRWRFKYLEEDAFLPNGSKEVQINCDVRAFKKFRRCVRHELFHYKCKGSALNTELLALLFEYIPLEKYF